MASGSEKRKYLDEYMKLGFTSITVSGQEKPQYVLCHKVLSTESMSPSKLKLHLETNHAQHAKQDPEFFKRHERNLKRQKLDEGGAFQQQNVATVQASYEVSLEIAKKKKPHSIGETLIKPCTLLIVEWVLGKAEARKVEQVSLSNNTVQHRIRDMSEDVKQQIINEIKAAPFGLFSFQLAESTDVSSCSQLLAFIRYVKGDDIKEEFLFYSALETTTKANDVMEKMKLFFNAGGIQWENACGVCTGGAPAMLGSKSGFQSKVKMLAPQAKGTHCMIYRYALACKTLPLSLKKVLEVIIKIVNYIKAGALNTRMFKELCEDMNAEHETLLYYTAVCWLSKGNVLNRVFELHAEVKHFLNLQGKHDLLQHYDKELWNEQLAYLADIFEQQNQLNLKLQGRATNIIGAEEAPLAIVFQPV
uniref:protein FAM200C-like n=1 Tax=Myxine glutinosa TaxID=7769 RepID=UPI00358F171D